MDDNHPKELMQGLSEALGHVDEITRLEAENERLQAIVRQVQTALDSHHPDEPCRNLFGYLEGVIEPSLSATDKGSTNGK